jgi:hypothetical protein
MSMGAGARIGLVTGLVAGWLSFGVNGIGLWVARFGLHQGAELDSLWTSGVQSYVDRNQQMLKEFGITGAPAARSMQWAQTIHNSMLTVEGRAGFVLGSFMVFSALLLVFATVGGAVGARVLTSPRRPGV